MPTQTGSQTERRPSGARLLRKLGLRTMSRRHSETSPCALPEQRPGWPVAAAICLFVGIASGWVSPVLATGISSNPDLTLICPSGGLGEPQFGDPRTGKTFLIADPQLKAAAVKVCNPPLLGGASSSVNCKQPQRPDFCWLHRDRLQWQYNLYVPRASERCLWYGKLSLHVRQPECNMPKHS
jgi:hypothetical protein